MYISQIEIDNFKSFAEKTAIPFRKGFTTVSGPNGSGKSNIIDSILFCLGLSSSRTMRAEKISDLVNNLSRRQEAIVTITFSKEAKPEHDTQANEDADENTDIHTPGNTTITVSRRIKGSPSGYSSTYYLNGAPSTLTEIHEYLGQYNISPGCFNVMMQGDVAGFVNMSPFERRKIIDEIAGVAEFDRKIEQAQKEMEATNANIERNTILLSEIEARLEQLSQEREQALKYQTLRDERQRQEGLLLAARYLDLKKSAQLVMQNLADARQQKEATQKTIRELNKGIQATRAELMTLAEAVKRKGEDQQIALKKQIEGLKGHVARKDDAIRFIEKQLTDNQQSLQRMEGEIKRQQENIEQINAEIDGFEYQVKELEELFRTEQKAYEKLNKKFDQMTESTGELSMQRNEVRAALERESDELALIQRKKLDIEAEIKRVAYERQLRLQGQTEFSEKYERYRTQLETLSRQTQDLTLEKSAFEAQLRKLQQDAVQVKTSLGQAEEKAMTMQREYMRLEAQKRAYDEVNFSRPVEMILNAGLSGVHGTLAQLAEVEDLYVTALEIAIGGRMQNIVVEDDRVAEEGIRFLQEKRGGRATFLPLNKIQKARSLSYPPSRPGVVDFALNLIRFDSLYQDIFAYALSDTLIVEDMQSARPLLRQYRMVTLDGSLMEKSGAMTGGSSPQKYGSKNKMGSMFSSNTQKTEQELLGLLKQRDYAEAQKGELQRQLTNLEYKLESVKNDYQACLTRFTRASAEKEALEKQVSELEDMQRRSVDTQDLEEKTADLTRQLAAYDGKISQQEAAVQQQKEALEAIDSKLPADELNALRKEISEAKFQMDYYDSQLRMVQADLQGKKMEKNYQEVGIQEYKNRIQQTIEHSKTIAKEKIEHQEEIRLTLFQISELDAQTNVLDEELKKLQDERDQVQSRLIEEEKNKSILERQAAQLEEQILGCQARRKELDGQITIAVETLTNAGMSTEDIDPGNFPPEEEINKSIARLTRRMQELEPVNMLAIKEYDDVQERRAELSEKIDTLNRELQTLTIKIAGYEELKLASFRKAFENVDNHFKAIFAELADGEGRLVLSNPETPFAGGMTIEAQPRGKKMQRIEAMSGGEKSLTSLAFVFSLQRYMPAPFYAMDEVDMNLDGINAEKLANMVKRESQGAQFIVVSLRKPMIEHSDRTVGVTQKRNGITKVTGVHLRDEESADKNP